MLEFMAKRVNTQLSALKKLNPNAFMFIDEPGLQFLFSGMAGYSDQAARTDMEYFFSLIDKPRGVHLCGNPDWDFLLGLDLDILSLDVYTNGEIFSSYASGIKRFLDRGAILTWGIVPANFEPFEKEDIDSLETQLENIWSRLLDKGIDRDILIAQGQISPATCCLINPDREKTVESAFKIVKKLSERMREKYQVE
jgi:hypothetical protein